MAERSLLAADYDQKPATYYSGPRSDFLAVLPRKSECRDIGNRLRRRQHGRPWHWHEKKCRPICRHRVIHARAAEIGTQRSLPRCLWVMSRHLDFPWAEQTFDALIMSEVLEHLIDPWRLLRRLLSAPARMAPWSLASSPNVSQYRVIKSSASR